MWSRSATNPIPKPSADSVVVQAHALTKRFGRHLAVDQLDLEIRAGEVFGLFGPSGAGKSTILGMLLGLVRPTSGELTLFDMDPVKSELPHQIGCLIESPAFYPFLTGRESLEALALAIGGVPTRSLNEVIVLAGLTDWADHKVKTYADGMRQRLGIASALLDDPALVILDEPTWGLEPAARHEVHQLIPKLARQGRTVILASRHPDDIAPVCDRATVLRQGRAIATGWIDDLLQRGDLELDFRDSAQQPVPGATKRRHVADAA